jgi:hypothetical protein
MIALYLWCAKGENCPLYVHVQSDGVHVFDNRGTKLGENVVNVVKILTKRCKQIEKKSEVSCMLNMGNTKVSSYP